MSSWLVRSKRFRVFGARCWIKDPHHTSKFAPKAHEGFVLGYGKDSHSYRVFNLFHYKVVEIVDVRFDETNGSQREHLPNVLYEIPPSESIKLMGTGEILPTEVQPKEELIISSPNQPEDNAQPKDNPSNDDMISKSKIFVQFILVLQVKYRLRR